jgi:hypothetical protein
LCQYSLGAGQVTAVMGGWVHNYPHLSLAGPSFGGAMRV